ncbi:YbaB/EbfC family nucleoid-associated protein [Ascidiimonas aurantiaca]|uniref:YbaB/EbfC family nucleoid-associated protein n=1 Tax=Ascidiimonas aurantiaca TaxID=1685432 RepID=UPI0030EE54B6
MFGDLMGMMGKLKETQAKIEETKKRLNSVYIEETSPGEKVKVVMTANREVKSITLSEPLPEDKEELEDYLVVTLNKAIQKASSIHETELGAIAKEGMPDIPGLNLFK